MILSDATRTRFEREVAKYPPEHRQSAVLACLAIVQQEQGHITAESEQAVADYLGMPRIAVREVATFYNMFNLQPVAISLPVYEYTSRSGKVYRVKSIPDLKRVIYRDYERGAIPPESITIPVTFRVTRRKSKAGLTYTRSVRGYDHEDK